MNYLLIVLIQSPLLAIHYTPMIIPYYIPFKKNDNPIEAPLNHHSSLIIPAEILTISYI